MVEPMLSDIKESRFYQEVAEEERHEEKREIAKTLFQKQMSVDFIVEVTGLSKKEILEIKRLISKKRNDEPA